MVAQLRQKIDEPAFNYFAQNLLEQANPNLFLPIPTMCIVGVNLDNDANRIEHFPQYSEIFLTQGVEEIPFRTCFPVDLIPAKVTKIELSNVFQAQHLNPSYLSLVKNTLALNLECVNENGFAALNLNSLRFFINLPRDLGLCLQESLFCDLIAVSFYDMSSSQEIYLGSVYAPHALELVGLKEDEIVIPRPFQETGNQLNTHARHLLHEFAQYPEKFLFFDLKGGKIGLEKILENCGTQLQLRFFFNDYLDKDVENALSAKTLCLNAVPVVNSATKTIKKVLNGPTKINMEKELNSQNLQYFFLSSVLLFENDKKPILAQYFGENSSLKESQAIYFKIEKEENFSSNKTILKLVNAHGQDIIFDDTLVELSFLALHKQMNFENAVMFIKSKSKSVEGVILLRALTPSSHQIKNFANLKRFSIAQLFYNPIKTVQWFISDSLFHKNHIATLMQLLKYATTKTFATEFLYKGKKKSFFMMSKGCEFEFSFRSQEARKNGAFLFLYCLSMIAAENCIETSFVRFVYVWENKNQSELQKYIFPVLPGKLT